MLLRRARTPPTGAADRFADQPGPANKESGDGRKGQQPPGYVPQQPAPRENARHHVPGEGGDAPGDYYLVRQFLAPASPRRPGTAHLQARDLDDHAVASARPR